VHQIISGVFTHSIDKIVLIRPGAVTHHFDNDQRYIELAFSVTDQIFDELNNEATIDFQVTTPLETLGPPGWYMLFAIETDGSSILGHRVPSLAAWIQLL
jgi:hypothetical protein